MTTTAMLGEQDLMKCGWKAADVPPMITEKLKELAQLKAQAAKLKAQLLIER